MEEAKRRIQLGIAATGDLICSNYQTLGRGRQGNSWFSATGNLHVSLILQTYNNDQYNQLALLSGTSVVESLKYGLSSNSIKLKWPNDIFFYDLKVGGILVEELHSVTSHKKKWSIIGIGINIDHNPEIAAPSAYLNAKSMFDINYQKLLFKWLDILLNKYKMHKLKSENTKMINNCN